MIRPSTRRWAPQKKRRRAATLALAVVTCAAASCARPLPPPGGERDRVAPQILSTRPEPLAVVPRFSDAVVFEFDERISERNVSDAIVLVSPATSEARVDRGRSAIRVSLADGWETDQVYRVVLLPGVRDLFGNERREPAELVFSTGAEIVETAVAGLVTDRITGRPATDALVEARRREDGVVYPTVPDTGAFFALRYLPVGVYDVRAYLDPNRNRKLDPTEALARGSAVSLNGATDTATVVLSLVPQDSTPAILSTAMSADSAMVRLSFDDYIDPDAPLDSARVRFFALPDSTEVSGNTPALMFPAAHQQLLRARADSLAAADTSGVARRLPPGGRGGPGAAQEVRPSQQLVAVPAPPLTPGSSYVITVEGLTNISGVPGGGGHARFEVPARRDTATVRPDTTAARRDTVTTASRS